MAPLMSASWKANPTGVLIFFISLSLGVLAMKLIPLGLRLRSWLNSSKNKTPDSAVGKENETEQEQLATLGLLTASIEHDIRNPLEVISSEIRRMKKRYQSHDEIVDGL